MQRAGDAAGAGGVDAGLCGLETGCCGGERGMRGAQSTQSAPYAHIGNSELGLSQLFIQSGSGGGKVPPRES
jgi:hypothetical protein